MDDDYKLTVQLSFDRSEGEDETTFSITLGNDGDHLDKMLAAMTEFLHALGFGYVNSLAAVNEDGDEICAS